MKIYLIKTFWGDESCSGDTVISAYRDETEAQLEIIRLEDKQISDRKRYDEICFEKQRLLSIYSKFHASNSYKKSNEAFIIYQQYCNDTYQETILFENFDHSYGFEEIELQ